MSKRFSRQIRLSEVGERGQDAIKKSRILIVGMGGLGCPAAQYLVAAGVGCLGIIDGDRVEETNLHRQILYFDEDIGRAKVEVAAARLQALNPSTEINYYFAPLDSENSNPILQSYDIILDCTDNFEVKYLLNDVCLRMKKTLVSASATGFEASLMVIEEGGPCLRCLYPQVNSDDIGNCNIMGVLGAFVGIVGSWQAAETLKILLSRTEQQRSFLHTKGKVLFFDFYTSQIRSVALRKNPDCFCVHQNCNRPEVKKESLYLTADQIGLLRDYVLIDVRSVEEREHESFEGFGGGEVIHIPYQEIISNEFDSEFWRGGKKYVFFCSMGKRSTAAAQWLRDQGVQSAYSLRGK
ncbi:MAG TPA: HesA/MoeB/ThiF family protein [Pseudobdellovibrionaceae bacterium]|jgi:adenylyltransferase/sulfurtransferase